MEKMVRMWKLDGRKMMCVTFNVSEDKNKNRKRLINSLQSSGFSEEKPKGVAAIVVHEKISFGDQT